MHYQTKSPAIALLICFFSWFIFTSVYANENSCNGKSPHENIQVRWKTLALNHQSNTNQYSLSPIKPQPGDINIEIYKKNKHIYSDIARPISSVKMAMINNYVANSLNNDTQIILNVTNNPVDGRIVYTKNGQIYDYPIICDVSSKQTSIRSGTNQYVVSDIVLKNGLYYEKDGSLATGIVAGYLEWYKDDTAEDKKNTLPKTEESKKQSKENTPKISNKLSGWFQTTKVSLRDGKLNGTSSYIYQAPFVGMIYSENNIVDNVSNGKFKMWILESPNTINYLGREGTLKDGLEHGVSTSYTHEKKTMSKFFRESKTFIPYINGKKHGLEKSYEKENGEFFLARETPYKNDKKDGIEREFEKYNGKVGMIKIITYLKGFRDGIEEEYDLKSGITTSSIMYKGAAKNGKSISLEKLNIPELEGQKITEELVKYVEEYWNYSLISRTVYYESGEILETFKQERYKGAEGNGLFFKKNGKYIRYYKNGVASHTVDYFYGAKVGVETKYYNDGRIKSETPYKEINSKYPYIRVEFHGEIVYKKVTDDGKAHGVKKEYYQTGVTMRESTYIEGELTGFVVDYDRNGTISKRTPAFGDIIVNSRDTKGPSRKTDAIWDYKDAVDDLCRTFKEENHDNGKTDFEIKTRQITTYKDTPFIYYAWDAEDASETYGVGPLQSYFSMLQCSDKNNYNLVHSLTDIGSCLTAYGALLFLEERVTPQVLVWLLQTSGNDRKPTHINEVVNTPGNKYQSEYCSMYHQKLLDILGSDELRLKE